MTMPNLIATHRSCNAWCGGGEHAVLVYSPSGRPPTMGGLWRIDHRDVAPLRCEPAPEAPPIGTPPWSAFTVWFRWF